jgi:hypothetical protein
MNYINTLNETRLIYKDHLKYQQNVRIMKNNKILIPQLKKNLVPAQFFNIHTRINTLYNKRKELYFQYKIIQDKIILSDTPASYKQEYNQLLKELNDIQDEIDEIYEYFDKLEVDTSIEDKIKSCQHKIDSYYKDQDKSEYVKQKRILYKLYKEFREKYTPETDYGVLVLPKLEDLNALNVVIVKEKPKQKAIAPKNIAPANVKIIKSNIKELIKNVFKPKTKEECASQKRSQPYFMKKEDILTTIEENPDIKSVLPENYKTLNKENLCEHLFAE